MRITQENDRNSFAQTSIGKREEEKLKNSSLSTIEKDTAMKVQKGNHVYAKEELALC
jgi:hypothetical protein